MTEKLSTFRQNLLFIFRALIKWETAARSVYGIFSTIYRHPILSNVLVLVIHAVLLFAIASIVRLHKALLPVSGPLNLFYTYVVPGISLLLAILLYSIPLLLIAHSDRVRKTLLFEVSQILDRIGKELTRARKGTPQNVGAALDSIIASVEEGGASNFLLTPNAFYITADKWRFQLKKHLPQQSGPLNIVDMLASKAPAFRDALVSFSGELHMILPDYRNRNVRAFLQERALTLKLPKDILVSINEDATNWIKRELRKARKAEHRSTFLHLTNRSPGYRFMMLDEVCYLQEFPFAGHGVQQPIIKIERKSEPEAFAAIECGLKSISSVF
ncbi:MAG TPA: hypothetical protein VK582_23510 [Pyrinomonadaceae bacterium]|nr:hypothetical protein [Pyrinomonadaceae bacterium]